MEKRTALILEASSISIAVCALTMTGIFGFIELKDKRRLETPVIVGSFKNSRDEDKKSAAINLSFENIGQGIAYINNLTLSYAGVLDYERIYEDGKTRVGTLNKNMEVESEYFLLKPGEKYFFNIRVEKPQKGDFSIKELMDGFTYTIDCETVFESACDFRGSKPLQ